MSSSIGERISYIRESTTINQETIASYLGMSRSNLSGIETGRISPSLHTMCSLALIFDLYADWLILGSGESPDIKRSYDRFLSLCHSTFHLGKKIEPLLPNQNIEKYLIDFSVRLKIHRKKLNLTQDDMQSKFGIPRSSYALIEKAKSNVTANVLEVILKNLDVSADWLLFGIEPHQKGVIYPKDIYPYKTEEEKNILYRNRLEHESWKNKYKDYDIFQIQKQGYIPFHHLSSEQIALLVEKILEYEKQNNNPS